MPCQRGYCHKAIARRCHGAMRYADDMLKATLLLSLTPLYCRHHRYTPHFPRCRFRHFLHSHNMRRRYSVYRFATPLRQRRRCRYFRAATLTPFAAILRRHLILMPARCPPPVFFRRHVCFATDD